MRGSRRFFAPRSASAERNVSGKKKRSKETYEQYDQLKIRLEECAENLATLTSELDAAPNLQTQTRTALERLRAERFVALIVGNFNVGKSALINALVG